MSSDSLPPTGWHWATLQGISATGRSVVSGPFGSSIGKRFFVASGVPVIRGNNLSTGMEQFYDDGFVFLTPEKANDFKSHEALPDDLVFTAAGTIGQVGLIPKQSKFPKYIISNKQLRVRLDSSKMNPRYAYYWFASPGMVNTIQNRNTGSTIPLINLSVLRSLPVLVPPIGEQDTIVQFLSAFDERITILRETNKTLESIAQAIFKSWFVDFDPVRAKAEGRQPEGMDEETATLFPDSFRESKWGSIPAGWTRKTFLDTVDVLGGGTPKTKVQEYWNGSIPWFSVVDSPLLSDIWVVDTQKRITKRGLKESSTRLLPVGTTIISARGTVGNLALTGSEMAMNQSCYGLRGKSGDCYFTYFSTHGLVAELQRNVHGSVFDTITRDTLAGVTVTHPGSDCIRAFEDAVRPIMDRMRTNILAGKSIASLRDTLLPRLISGRLRIPEAQALAESALP